jgi:hypothetical protein
MEGSMRAAMMALLLAEAVLLGVSDVPNLAAPALVGGLLGLMAIAASVWSSSRKQ